LYIRRKKEEGVFRNSLPRILAWNRKILIEERNKVPESNDLNTSDILYHDRQSRKFMKLENAISCSLESSFVSGSKPGINKVPYSAKCFSKGHCCLG